MKTLGAIASILACATPVPASGATCNIGYDDDDLGTLDMGAPAFPFAQQRYGYAPQRQAPRFGGRMIPAAIARSMPPQGVPRSYLYPQNPGAPQVGLKLQPLGLGQVAFTATSGTLLNLAASPQRAFKAKRLIVDITRTGTSATGLVTVNAVNVGVDNQLAGSGPLAAAAFAATAFDANIEFAPATPGITITVQLAITAAPTMTDVVNAAGVMFGASYG